MELGVFIHDPCHHLRVGVHIGRGNVLVVADEEMNAPNELSRQALELLGVKFRGVAVDAALGTAEGEVDHRGLPGHQ